MRFDFKIAKAVNDAINYILTLENKTVEIKEYKKTRTNDQNASRWLYLEMVATELNNQGQTYEPKGMSIEIIFTKELLYNVYWQSVRGYLYPNKKGQLDTKEFSKVVDMVQALFVKLFEINIPFPSMLNLQNRI